MTRHPSDVIDRDSGKVRGAPFRINWTVRDNTRCGHKDYGNGVMCDDCWWGNIQDSTDEAEPARPAPKRKEPVPCQATLF